MHIPFYFRFLHLLINSASSALFTQAFLVHTILVTKRVALLLLARQSFLIATKIRTPVQEGGFGFLRFIH